MQIRSRPAGAPAPGPGTAVRSVSRVATRLAAALMVSAGSVLGLTTCYLLALLGAAAGRSRRPPATVPGGLRFAIVVPAHDEEAGIEETLASLRRLDYPADRYEVIVVADNCRDRTAALARAVGATVYERHDPERPGKGHALAWALERLLAERPEAEAVVVVDADCCVSPNLLAAMEVRLRDGASAVQANYVVANPGASWSSGLRFAAFALINTVRPLGKERLGLSCGLLGTGMGFSRALLDRQPWQAFSITEDRQYHLQLVEAGERVVFVPEASVSSPMPTSLRGAREQQLRWEGGRWRLAGEWMPRLIRSGLRRGDPVRLHAALEPLVPPQSLLLAGIAPLAVLAVGLRSRAGLWLAAASLLGQTCYVVGGLLLVRAPAAAFRALALAPVLAIWKLGLYARVLLGRGPTGWVRTDRETATVHAGGGRR